MSQTNGTTNRKVLSFEKFYQLCSVLKDRKGDLLAERPSLARAARMLGQMLGFRVNGDNVRRAQEATGIKWESTFHRHTQAASAVRNKFYVLMDAVLHLYAELGVPPTPDLAALHQSIQAVRKEAMQP